MNKINIKVKVIHLAGALLMTISNTSFSQVLGKISLEQFASQNSENYNKILSELVATGEEGLQALLDIVKNKESEIVAAEYAITAFIQTVSDPQYDAKKREGIIKILSAEADNASEGNFKEFMVRELMVLGVNYDKKNDTSVGASIYDELRNPSTPQEIEAVLSDSSIPRQGRFYILDNAIKNIENSAVVSNCLNNTQDDEAKVDMLYWLGESGIASNGDVVSKFVTDKQSVAVCKEAANTLTKLSREGDIEVLANLYGAKEPAYADIATTALKVFPGKVADFAVKMFDKANNVGKAGILSLVSQRRASNYIDLVKQHIESSDIAIQDAAFDALINVVGENDTPYLYSLLEKCGENRVEALQKAVIASFANVDTKQANLALIAKKNSVAAEYKDLYWSMVITTSSMDEVFEICTTAQDDALFEMAFTAYITRVRDAKEAGALQLIRYREIMPLARTADQKKRVLDQIARTDCFIAMIYAGEFINDAEVQHSAAQVIRKIAPTHIEFNGPEIVALLKQTAIVITGTDPGYEVKAINTHLENLPKDEVGYIRATEYLKEKTLDIDGTFDIYIDLKPENGVWSSYHAVKTADEVNVSFNGKPIIKESEQTSAIKLIFDILTGIRQDFAVRDAFVKY